MVNSVGGFGNDPWKIGQNAEMYACPKTPVENNEDKNIFAAGFTEGNTGASQVAAGAAVSGFETSNPIKATQNSTNPNEFDWRQLSKFDTYKIPEVDAKNQWMA